MQSYPTLMLTIITVFFPPAVICVCSFVHVWEAVIILKLVCCFALHSSCLEWRCTYPLLEEAGLEAWAVDVLGWGFSDLG